MIDDNEIKKQLHRPVVPQRLEKDIFDQWQTQGTVRNVYRPWQSYLIVGMLGVILFSGIIHYLAATPSIVSFAIADIKKDQFVGAGLKERYRPWLNQKNITLPPKEMAVELSKFCKLDRRMSFHLKIAGQYQGKVHLFILDANPGLSLWNLKQGEINSMSWRIINPRPKLYVLVIFTKDMKRESVTKLIHKMFYV